MSHDVFYHQVGDDEFESTPATASPWDDALQHGGPPAALLARAIEAVRPDETMPIARITVDMLGGIPQGRMRTEAAILRPGRRVEMVEAKLFAGDRLAVSATAWRIRTDAGSTSSYWMPEAPPPVPGPQPEQFFVGVSPDWGYGRAIDWRFVDGGYTGLGPARVWTRVRIPLVAGEKISPVQRLLVVADSTNGVSGEMPLAEWLFIPPTMTVTFQRVPESDWVLLDARSEIGPHGTGVAQARVCDERGLVAVVAQPLLVAPRR